MAAMIVNAPLARPEDPQPAMERPTISMADDWAAPQTADPSSKMKKNKRKDHLNHHHLSFSSHNRLKRETLTLVLKWV